MSDIYKGAVCYRDGWHWSVDKKDQPDKKLCLEDGVYRVATDTDVSWHDQHHGQFVHVEPR